MLEQDRPGALRQAIQAMRKGGTVSIPGVYSGMLDKVPFGAAFGKDITMKRGQTNMQTSPPALTGSRARGGSSTSSSRDRVPANNCRRSRTPVPPNLNFARTQPRGLDAIQN